MPWLITYSIYHTVSRHISAVIFAPRFGWFVAMAIRPQHVLIVRSRILDLYVAVSFHWVVLSFALHRGPCMRGSSYPNNLPWVLSAPFLNSWSLLSNTLLSLNYVWEMTVDSFLASYITPKSECIIYTLNLFKLLLLLQGFIKLPVSSSYFNMNVRRFSRLIPWTVRRPKVPKSFAWIYDLHVDLRSIECQ